MTAQDNTRRKNLILFAILSVLIWFFVLEGILEAQGLFWARYIEYLIVFASAPVFLVRLICRSTRKAEILKLTDPILVFALLFAFAGVVSWARCRVQPLSLTLLSMLEHYRFWLGLYLFYVIASEFDLASAAKKLALQIRLLCVLIIGTTIADMIFHIWPRQEYRHGIGSIQIFFGHPSVLAIVSVFLIGCLLLLTVYVRFLWPWIFAMFLPLCMTLRVRMLGFAFCLAVIFLLLVLKKHYLRLPHILIALVGLLGIGGYRIWTMYFYRTAWRNARTVMTVTSLQVARDHVPFGAGFGTYGSRIAQIFYSPLYFDYGLFRYLGLDPLWPSFACDTFWPMLLGETGFIGLALYIVMVVMLCIKVRRTRFGEHRFYVTALVLLLFLLLESTSALAFSGSGIAMITLPLGMALYFGTKSPSAGSGVEEYENEERRA